MEIFGIGPLELIFIILIALVVLGPRDMVQAGRTIGSWLRKLVTSPGWQVFLQTSRELRSLPNRLMREANQELQELQKISDEVRKSVPTEELAGYWNEELARGVDPAQPEEKSEQSIAPPAGKPPESGTEQG